MPYLSYSHHRRRNNQKDQKKDTDDDFYQKEMNDLQSLGDGKNSVDDNFIDDYESMDAKNFNREQSWEGEYLHPSQRPIIDN